MSREVLLEPGVAFVCERWHIKVIQSAPTNGLFEGDVVVGDQKDGMGVICHVYRNGMLQGAVSLQRCWVEPIAFTRRSKEAAIDSPTIPASGPPVCCVPMRISDYGKPGHWWCSECGTYLSPEAVEAGRPKPGEKPKPASSPEAVTFRGQTFKPVDLEKVHAEWCFESGALGTIHLLTTRDLTRAEREQIQRAVPASVIVLGPTRVDKLPAHGFHIDDQGRRVPL